MEHGTHLKLLKMLIFTISLRNRYLEFYSENCTTQSLAQDFLKSANGFNLRQVFSVLS